MKNFLIKTLLGAAGQLLNLIFTSLIGSNVFDQLLRLAQAEVQKLEGDTSLDNETKRQTAVTNVKASVTALGLDIRDSLIHLALELSVAGLRAAIK